ncbi:uncharacterized protein LOC117094234 [Trachypithecus francoisi]|uniref:uncharacterized protein LOC117094234 n=1 Tax=Trachypithecus francoisi TaxID=54180 RepID=UPI00141B9506|nr:uncharacterized protein LOC117094234 [Trachypithecus francoisi]
MLAPRDATLPTVVSSAVTRRHAQRLAARQMWPRDHRTSMWTDVLMQMNEDGDRCRTVSPPGADGSLGTPETPESLLPWVEGNLPWKMGNAIRRKYQARLMRFLEDKTPSCHLVCFLNILCTSTAPGCSPRESGFRPYSCVCVSRRLRSLSQDHCNNTLLCLEKQHTQLKIQFSCSVERLVTQGMTPGGKAASGARGPEGRVVACEAGLGQAPQRMSETCCPCKDHPPLSPTQIFLRSRVKSWYGE